MSNVQPDPDPVTDSDTGTGPDNVIPFPTLPTTLAQRLSADRVHVPVTAGGAIDVEHAREHGLMALSDPEAPAYPCKPGFLVNGFQRFLSDAPPMVGVIALPDGTAVQWRGEDCPEAVDLVVRAIRSGAPLKDIEPVVDDEWAKIRDEMRADARRIRRGRLAARSAAETDFAPSPKLGMRPRAIDAETLLSLDFPPVEYVVPGYITEGLTILAGRPKLGKSWMALGMCVGVASGGRTLDVDCEPGDALYLALEDNQRRLQDRLRVVLPRYQRPNVQRLQLMTEAPKVGAGLLERLDQWRISVAEPKLVVVDTLSMVRPPKKANQDSYASDYDAISPLQKWAGEHRLAVIVVHHVRKAEAEDPLESVSGTNGLTGAADTILVLNRAADGPKLYGRGRDIEEFEKALRLQDGQWSVLGNADEVKRSEQRKKIMAILEEATGCLTPADIAKQASVQVGSVNYLLRAMVKAGEAEKVGYGAYKLPGR